VRVLYARLCHYDFGLPETESDNPTLAEVREACKGNFCRCGTYPRVFEAALAAAKAGKSA
jgi:aerobic-type carbon monoxide dehydrogenase small subunit (CoxS/CutS family)